MGNLAYDGSALRISRAARKSAVSKPFVKLVVNRCQNCSRVVVAPLGHPQAPKPKRASQLPEQSALLPRHVELRPKTIFRRRDGPTGCVLKQQLAFDAQQFGIIIPLPGAVRTRQCLINRYECLAEPSAMAAA